MGNQRKIKISNYSAAILSGGKNSRFNGENKAQLKLDNQKIIDRILNVLTTIFDEIIIVSNQKDLYSEYTNVKIVSDYYKEIGPLGGIHSALKNANNDNVFIVSCDMPFLNKDMIIKQIEFHHLKESDITIPRLADSNEPLHGIYKKSIISILEKHIQSSDNYRIRSLFEFISISYFLIDTNEKTKKIFTNINNPDDYNKINSFINS